MREKKVRRLEVAMHDSERMRLADRFVLAPDLDGGLPLPDGANVRAPRSTPIVRAPANERRYDGFTSRAL